MNEKAGSGGWKFEHVPRIAAVPRLWLTGDALVQFVILLYAHLFLYHCCIIFKTDEAEHVSVFISILARSRR